MILNTNWDPLKALKRCSTIPGMAATWDVQETSSWAGTRREQNWVGTCPIDLEWCVYIYMYVCTDTHTWAFADPMTWWIQDPLWEQRLWYQVRGPPFLLTALFLTAPFRRTVGRQARRDARKIHHGTANNMGITNVLQFTLHIDICYCNSQLKMSIVAPYIYNMSSFKLNGTMFMMSHHIPV